MAGVAQRAGRAGNDAGIVPAGTAPGARHRHHSGGHRIPLELRIDGNVVQEGEFTLPLALARPIDVLVVDGKPSGLFRVADGAWKNRSAM
jgi:hypothetical protein